MAIRPTTAPTPIDWPLYWFARLEKAIEENNLQAATEAQQELARLGIDVRYRHPKPKAVGRA
jgi:hypothetical protein